MRVAILVAILAWPVVARGDEPIDDGTDPNIAHAPVTNRINLRVGGASTDDTGYPTICMDVRIAAGFGVESCGTGQALLHNEPGNEMAHFRATYTFLERSLWKGNLHARGGLGFAELQLGIDNPGFKFGSPDQDRGSVAGPEASLSAQWLLPMYKDFDFVVTGTAGLAYFAGAPELATSRSELQSFASIEAGIGW
ncbi:MAG: hypothetical protein JWP01_1083 [Myxococcales bacterium]|nr:hypothetical protein [Myxococcales bacterium]